MALRARYEIAVIVIVFLVLFPVSALSQETISFTPGSIASDTQTAQYSIKLFIPSSKQIHSDQVKDLINGPDGEVLIATAFGLSTFNGTWSTRHINRDNISEGLMDDFITAVEFDHNGNLWLGYSGGIQIYHGVHYQVIRDQQLLKETRINDLQRWNDDMWVATGNAGVHRYRNGEWTWFQPMTKNGPGFYEIDSMALDSANNSLLIATVREGLWIVRAQDDPVHFEMLADRDSAEGQMQHVKRDPLGGVYFFNPDRIVHYDTISGFNEILTPGDLTQEQISINDIAAGSDGSLYIAADNGLYVWREGAVYRHLNRFEGIGTSAIVKTVNVDAHNRVWFATQGYVGYYLDTMKPREYLRIDIVTPAPRLIPVTTVNITPVQPTPTATDINPPFGVTSIMTIVTRITDPITQAISAVARKFGVNIFS
jgi:ligand-binding sensor domain-containing protein